MNEVDGWNAWFFNDHERLAEAWPGFNKNKETVVELWIAFLEYYAR